MLSIRYFLQTFLLFFLVSLSCSEVNAASAELSYEKFYRLNKPIYRSESGDWLGLGFETKPPIENLDTYLSGDLRFYFQDKNSLNYSVQEAFVLYKGDDFSFTIGRKILDWNVNEKYWSLGYLNALQSFTLLSTEEEGVTGVVYNKTIGNFSFDLLGSYLFIPQINPSIDFKNGNVQSKSEWVRLPPRKTVVSGLEVPIYYQVSDYKIKKIIFNKSLGANVSYKWGEGGISGFAVYKPENTLRINASAYYDNLNTGKVIVTADPTINHHAYYGLQIFQGFGDIKARGGLSYVDPNAKIGKDFLVDITNARKTFKSEYFNINPRYDKEAYAHMSLNYDKKRYYKLSLNYIHLISKNIRGNDDFFSDTVKWKSTFGAGIEYFFNDIFDLAFDLKYDVIRKDNILKSEVKYHFNRELSIALGLEVLKAPDNNSYWSYYRTSDTLYSKLGMWF
ncbi:MAG: hypothetical protein K2Q18_04145 [Bdellovibrionales bacterium]|nr:hypothetical protein [Bdellovibrionales bacterium]